MGRPKKIKSFEEMKKSKLRNLRKNTNRKTPSNLKYASRKNKPMTSIEFAVNEILIDIGDEFKLEIEREFPIQWANQYKFFDFRVGDKILIECDGSYWHQDMEVIKKRTMWLVEVKKNDLMKNFIAKRNGFELLRFKEHEINMESDKVREKIRSTIIEMQNTNKEVDNDPQNPYIIV